MTRARGTLAIGLGFAFLAGVFAWPMFTPRTVDRRFVVAGDFSDQFFPFARYVADELNAGRLPLWNPFVFGGHPFLADPQTAVLYPISSGIALVLGRSSLSYRALELELPIHFALAAMLTFLFARRAFGSDLGGTVAGLAYGFGGFLTSYPAQQLAILRTAVWLPAVLYLLDRALGARLEPRFFIAAGGALAVALFAGHAQTALFTVYAAVAFTVWRARATGRGWSSAIALSLVVPALGAAFAAPQLLPTLELVPISTRDLLAYDAAAYGYEMKALAGIILPGWRGEQALYVGIAPLALGALALARFDGPTRFWAGIALVALVISVGGRTFLYRALFLFAPGWDTFRDQERAAMIWSFALAMLAAAGVASLTGWRTDPLIRRWRFWLRVTLLGVLVLALQVLILWTSRRAEPVNPYDSLFESVVFLLLLLGLTWALFTCGPGSRKALAPMLVGLVVLDLFTVNGGNNLGANDPSQRARRESALAWARAEVEPYRLRADDDRLVPPNLGMVWRAPMMTGDSPIQLRRTSALLESRQEYRLWQLFNVKYHLSGAVRDDPALEALGEADGLHVYRVRYSLPRAWAVSDVRFAPGLDEALALTLAPDLHPGDTAVVEDRPGLEIVPGLARPDVMVSRMTPEEIAVDVRSTGNALLIVADAWHPAWRAYIDGVSTPILRTNVAFRGVALPAGSHQVMMRFEPRAFWLGIALAAVAVLGSALMLLLGSRRPRV